MRGGGANFCTGWCLVVNFFLIKSVTEAGTTECVYTMDMFKLRKMVGKSSSPIRSDPAFLPTSPLHGLYTFLHKSGDGGVLPMTQGVQVTAKHVV